MPRKCFVSKEDAIKIIIKNIEHFKNGLPAFTSDVWKSMAEESNGAWNFRGWYTNVKYNRRNVLGIALERMNLSCEFLGKTTSPHADDCDSHLIENSTSGSSHEQSSDSSEIEEYKEFDLYLSVEEWNKIKPKVNNNRRTNHTLKPYVWSNVIAEAFWRQHRLPCAYVFKRSEISVSSSRTFFLKIIGRCSSQKCRNIFYGVAARKPDNESEVHIRVKTRNTKYCDHENVRRPLNGLKRKLIGKACAAEGSSNVLKQMAMKIEPGDTEPPILPSLDVLSRAKSEHMDEVLGVKRSDKGNPVRAIYEMQFQQPYVSCIQDLAHCPFYAFYGTLEQTSAYQQYCGTTNTSKICIEATGDLVQRIVRPHCLKSEQIFLYCIRIDFDDSMLSVYQMLSEAQDTEIIHLWLRRWLRRVGRKPNQVITDYSRALLSACSKAFNELSLKNYVNKFFESIANNEEGVLSEFISTYLRIDIVHIIKMACRWNCFKFCRESTIKDFYVRCVALLIECKTLQDFSQIFSLICCVAIQPYENSTVYIHNVKTTKDARHILESCISTRCPNVETYLEEACENDATILSISEDLGSISPIEAFIKSLIDPARLAGENGTDLNTFYLPNFVDHLWRIGKEFPLWSAVGLPFDTDHASSSVCENNVGDIKDKALNKYSKNVRVDKFVRTHLMDLLGGARI